MSTEQREYQDDPDVRRIRQIAEDLLGLAPEQITREGVEANGVGLRTEHLLVSQRLDSRTYFVQDERYGVGRPAGVYDGSDDDVLTRARRVMEQLQIPSDEIADTVVLKEQGQAAEFDRRTGAARLEEVSEGKHLARLARSVAGLPVWSSHMLLGLAKDGQIGFMQLHWPEISSSVLDEARRMAATMEKGWRPPEQPGAKVESVEVGIIHSPAVGLLMDVFAAIRVIYQPTDETFGRKLMLHLDRHGSPVPTPRQLDLKPEPPRGPRAVAKLPELGELERARGRYRALLISNPNYFGNLEASDFEPQLVVNQDTQFEELVCVGYEPQLERLEAVVHVKLQTGYGGDVCSAGTPEHVRFYLSFDGGVTWQDQGADSFRAYDIPGPKPLEYDVSLIVDPPSSFCFVEKLARVRAILSWNNPPPPNTPNFTPVWGNVKDADIQIAPLQLFPFGDLLEELKIELPAEALPLVDLQSPAPKPQPTALSAVDLHALYSKSDVPGHRYLYPEIQRLVSGAQIATLALGSAPPAVFAQLENLDVAALLKALLDTDGDASFEELRCVGLNPNQDALIGTLTVKQPNGYSGGLCSNGSLEYVAFWADFGSGWSYQGTTSVRVHDLSSIPQPDGLQYSVFLPINLAPHRQPCQLGAKTARVRAILSWASPPPSNDPNFVPTWGNREETLMHIAPGTGTSAQVPYLSRAGNVPETQIDAAGFAHGVSPFGGRIDLAGAISNPTSGLKYRVVRKPHAASDLLYAPVANEPAGLSLVIDTWDPINGWQQTFATLHADAQGYYPYEDYSPNHKVHHELMGEWYSTIAEDNQAFDLRIDLSTDGNPANDLHSNVVTVLVDNTPPVALLGIDLGVGVQCADFAPGTTFTGHFTATDLHFSSFGFTIEPHGPPNDPPHGVLPAPPSGLSLLQGGTIGDPGVAGGVYTLNTGVNPGPPQTGPMDPCGYALILDVYDRTIVNSGATNHHARASVGFCLHAPNHDA